MQQHSRKRTRTPARGRNQVNAARAPAVVPCAISQTAAAFVLHKLHLPVCARAHTRIRAHGRAHAHPLPPSPAYD
eukprot:6190685-Pleurochrysis_carterae.AAC.2